MTPAAAWVIVALVAVLVGAVIPVLLQLRRTLKAAERTLARAEVTLERIDKASEQLELGVNRISSLLAALGGIGDALAKFRSSMGAVASLGSVLGAALLGAFGRGTGKGDEVADGDLPVEPKGDAR